MTESDYVASEISGNQSKFSTARLLRRIILPSTAVGTIAIAALSLDKSQIRHFPILKCFAISFGLASCILATRECILFNINISDRSLLLSTLTSSAMLSASAGLLKFNSTNRNALILQGLVFGGAIGAFGHLFAFKILPIIIKE